MSDVHADEVTQQTIETARRWWDAAHAVPVQGSAARLTEVLRDPEGLDFARGFADRVVRPEDDRVAAAALDALSRRTPALLPWHLRAAISFGGGFGPIAPRPIMPVARRALELSATAIILAHNHPSGDPAPSAADVAMTREIVTVLAPLKIVVHDPVILGRNGHASLKGLSSSDPPAALSVIACGYSNE